MPTPSVGLVGLGSMGSSMAGRLVATGFDLVVFDRETARGEAFIAGHPGKATLAASVADLGRQVDRVITMLPNGKVVRDVAISGIDPLADSMASGGVIVDMSTSDPIQTRQLGGELASRGLRLVDAPVGGGAPVAAAGQLSIMVGSDDLEALEKCQALFDSLGSHTFHVGGLGAGHAMKALNNLISATGFLMTVEALLVGRKFGLDPKVMIEVLNASSGRNSTTMDKSKQFIFTRNFNSGFALGYMLKDVTIALDLARSTGVSVPLAAASREQWAAACMQMDPAIDYTNVVRWMESMAHAELILDDTQSVR